MENNPPAFAAATPDGKHTSSYLQPGMALLDYFAGQALCGILASDPSPTKRNTAISESYRLAKQMLIEREKHL